MGIMNKLMFWKKKKEEGFGDISGLGLPPETPPEPALGLPKEEGLGLPSAKPYFGPEPATSQPSQMAAPQQMGVQPASVQPAFQPVAAQPSEQAYMASKNMEVISAKLDSLKAAIENINQRLANIERLAEESVHEEKKTRW